jgi:uncharacterized Zn finger protein
MVGGDTVSVFNLFVVHTNDKSSNYQVEAKSTEEVSKQINGDWMVLKTEEGRIEKINLRNVVKVEIYEYSREGGAPYVFLN